jgi:predicted TIM-barrel fold metal-dependent hydrolase
MDKCLEEIRWGKEHGAVGVFKRAIEWEGKNVADSAWFPLYEECQRLDMAVCCHTGGENLSASSRNAGVAGTTVSPSIGCFAALSQRGVPERFPTLRFGVIEAMASWFPYVLSALTADALYSGSRKLYSETPLADPKADFLRSNRFYVTCQTTEDIPYLVRKGGEDSLMIGTDYSHDDRSGVIEALNFVERLGEDGEITMDQARKILVDNPREFYGL